MTDALPDPEPVIEPALAIVDPHHHLWDHRGPAAAGPQTQLHPFEKALALAPRYLLDEFLADLGAGHDVRATVFVECRSMYRAKGPPEFAPVGETEFVNGVAAISASGVYGLVRVAAGIVGHADLRLGGAVAPVLEAHLAAGGGRFRGVRHSAPWDADPTVLGPLARMPQGLYRTAEFRAGFARLGPLGLSFDTWVLEPQLDEVADLAAAFPDTCIVLDHVGTPLGVGAYAGRREERFPLWRAAIARLAERPNVTVKIGGLAMPFCGFGDGDPEVPRSAALADQWRPYVETCIESFGVDRCMFESNFPVDLYSCSYRTLWNALKRLAAGASDEEKAALFSGTARRVYRLGHAGG